MLKTSMLRVLLTRSFKPFIFNGYFENKLYFEDLENLGLYIHIPFCRSLCSFCPYCKVIYEKDKAEAYKAALLKEIDIVCSDMEGKMHAESLYFGGGTPALMIDDLKEIIDKLQEYFTIDGGVGVELHPGDINNTNLQKLKEAGVTMLSIGIQSFNDDCLKKLGRSDDKFVEKLRLVNKYGFDVVDVDLIFAIPGQTDEILANDIKKAFDNGATQVSTYPFIDFTFADNRYKPLSDNVKKDMLIKLSEYCRSINIDRTSVWTFAKIGTGKYSSVTRDTFLGFGVSATTLLKDTFKINTFSIEQYINRINGNHLPTSLTLKFTKRQRAVYYLFWGAYSMKIYTEKFDKIVGGPLDRLFGLEMRLAEKAGILKREGNIYKLTDKGALIYHDIEQVYTTAYIDKMWNISRNTPFPEKIVMW